LFVTVSLYAESISWSCYNSVITRSTLRAQKKLCPPHNI